MMKTYKDYKLYDTKYPVRIFYSEKNFRVVVFKGKQTKISKIKQLNNMEEVIEYIENTIQKLYFIQLERKRANEEKRLKGIELKKNINVGDVFYHYFSYENTYVTFFQIIAKPSASYVIVREISSILDTTGYMSGERMPIKDEFIREPRKCKLDNNGYISNIDGNGGKGRKTDWNTKHYVSWGY